MNIKYIIYAVIFFQTICTYARNISVTSVDIPELYVYKYNNNTAIFKQNIYSKSYGTNYYCRYDTCIMLYESVSKPYIEFPDEKGNIKTYILRSCIYNDKLNKTENCKKTIKKADNISIMCKSDSECFFNKCIDNNCVFNKESTIYHCDIIYKYFAIFEHSYVHCGKTYNDVCTNNNECSSNKCQEGICNTYIKIPDESTNSGKTFETIYSLIILVALISIVVIIYCVCYEKKIKKNTK